MEAIEVDAIEPLQGCLYCHATGTTSMVVPRRFLGLGSRYPLVKCSNCASVAQLDVDPDHPQSWQIRYRRCFRDAEYYYMANHLGNAGWLAAEEALAVSTRGFVQRQRVQQAKRGQFDWLQPAQLLPPLPSMESDEMVYLTLRAVTYQEAPPAGFLVRPDQGNILDSGKFYVTDRRLHLVGQRQDWSYLMSDIASVNYDKDSWRVEVMTGTALHQFRGTNVADQWDAQLVSAVLTALRFRSEDK